jgi:hypothetical protein
MRRPLRLMSGLVLSVVVGGAALAQTPAPPGQPPVAPPLSLSALIDQATALFPKVEADVAEVQGATLTLTAGRSAGVVPGLVLEVYREGREIRHPRTGKILGRAEETLGRATVSAVFDAYSTATLDGTAATAGDRVRTPPDKVRLAVLSLSAPGTKETLVEAAVTELYEGLNGSGRFTVTLGEQVAPWLRARGITPDEALDGRGISEAIRTFKLDNLLIAHFKMVEKKPFMEVRLFTGERPGAALAAAMFVPPSIKPVQPGRFSAADRANPTPEKKPRSLLARLLGGDLEANKYSADASIPLVEVGRVDFSVISMDVAMAPGDRIPRVALTDGERLYVYRIENRALVPDWTLSARSMGRVFSVQLADLLGDGTLQVVANRFDNRLGMNSIIGGLKNGKPTTLVDQIDGILLAVDEKGTGVKQALWAQPYSPETFFTKGRVDRMVLQNGSLVRDRAVVVPDNFRATGAAMAAVMAKDQRALVYIDEQNRLRISSGTDEMWTSSSAVGGGSPKIEVQRYIERGGRSVFYRLEPIPLAIDLDGDGLQEIVVPQNQLEGMLAVVYRGPAGIRLQQLNSGFEGTIAGLGGFPTEEGTAPTLVAAVVRHKNFLKVSGSTQIIMTVPE